MRGGISLQETGFGELGEAVEPKGRRPPCLRTPKKKTIHANHPPPIQATGAKSMPAPALCAELTTTRCAVITFWINMFAFPSPSGLSSSRPLFFRAKKRRFVPGRARGLFFAALCTPQLPSSSRSLLQAGTQVSQEPASVADPAPREIAQPAAQPVASAFRSPAACRDAALLSLTPAPYGPGVSFQLGQAGLPITGPRQLAKGCGPSFWRFWIGPAWCVGFPSKAMEFPRPTSDQGLCARVKSSCLVQLIGSQV